MIHRKFFAPLVHCLTAAIFLFAIARMAAADELMGAELAEYNLGKDAAAHDLRKGVITYVIVGEGRSTDAQLKATAKAKYHIDVVSVGGKVGPRVSYDRGYHEAVVDFLVKKYGQDPVAVIDELLRKDPAPTVDTGGVVTASLCFAAPLSTRTYRLEREASQRLLKQIDPAVTKAAAIDLRDYFRAKGAAIPPEAKAVFQLSDSTVSVTDTESDLDLVEQLMNRDLKTKIPAAKSGAPAQP